MALEKELKFFSENLENWKEVHAGKYALVKGEELAGTFDTPQAAFDAGVQRYGTEPFLIRRIAPNPDEVFIPVLSLGLLNARSA